MFFTLAQSKSIFIFHIKFFSPFIALLGFAVSASFDILMYSCNIIIFCYFSLEPVIA